MFRFIKYSTYIFPQNTYTQQLYTTKEKHYSDKCSESLYGISPKKSFTYKINRIYKRKRGNDKTQNTSKAQGSRSK